MARHSEGGLEELHGNADFGADGGGRGYGGCGRERKEDGNLST